MPFSFEGVPLTATPPAAAPVSANSAFASNTLASSSALPFVGRNFTSI